MCNCSYTSNFCMHTATLLKDDTCMHPKWCSRVGTIHSFDETYVTRRVKITDYHRWLFFFFSSAVTVWKYYWENWHLPFSLETTGVFNTVQGKKETNNGYFLWTLLTNTSPARSKRLEKTEISTIQMTVFSCCLQFILFSFTRYCGRGIQKVLHRRPRKGRSKHASCRGSRN